MKAGSLRVLCFSTLPTLGAGNRLRFEQYREPLRALGIDLEMSPFFDASAYSVLYATGKSFEKSLGVARGVARRCRDLARIRSFDVVVVYRESAPIGPPIIERVLTLLRIPFVFDFDDAIFLATIHPANRRWSWLRHPSRVSESARRARIVTVANSYLAAWARNHNPRVEVIPTAVDCERHGPADHENGLRTVLVWTGSSTTAPYLHLLDSPLTELADRNRDLVLRVIGGGYTHESVPVEQLEFDLAREAAQIASADIGVMPEPDDSWTRGKSAFKALLYMAAGLPVIASDVGVNREVVVEGVTGYCVKDDQWVAAIDRLIGDPALRLSLGEQGRRRVVEHYSVQAQVESLADVLRRAAGPA